MKFCSRKNAQKAQNQESGLGFLSLFVALEFV